MVAEVVGRPAQAWVLEELERRAPLAMLDPAAFATLGPFPTSPGTYTINTTGTLTITGPGSTSLQGVVYQDASGNKIAVFTFDTVEWRRDYLRRHGFVAHGPAVEDTIRTVEDNGVIGPDPAGNCGGGVGGDFPLLPGDGPGGGSPPQAQPLAAAAAALAVTEVSGEITPPEDSAAVVTAISTIPPRWQWRAAPI